MWNIEKFMLLKEPFKGDVIKESGLKEKDYLAKLREFTIELTKRRLKDAYGFDAVLVQSVELFNDLEKSNNLLYERLTEFYGFYNPEEAKKVNSMEELIALALKADKSQQIGWPLDEAELSILKELANKLKDNIEFQKQLGAKIEKQVTKYAPNLSKIATPIIAAKLIAQAGGMGRLSIYPSSTIQLLGAEKALFRHLERGTKPPKYGILLQHPEVAKAQEKGKTARQLANKIAIAVKRDYYGKNTA